MGAQLAVANARAQLVHKLKTEEEQEVWHFTEAFLYLSNKRAREDLPVLATVSDHVPSHKRMVRSSSLFQLRHISCVAARRNFSRGIVHLKTRALAEGERSVSTMVAETATVPYDDLCSKLRELDSLQGTKSHCLSDRAMHRDRGCISEL